MSISDMKNIKYTFLSLLIFCTIGISAQEDTQEGKNTFMGPILDQTAYTKDAFLRGIEYSIRVGYEIGGTSPLPLPAEIRKIEGFKPGMHFYIEGNVSKSFGIKKRWGMLLGLRLEQKGMRTKAQVKNYFMRMEGDKDEEIEGPFTGHVDTDVNCSYLSIPVLATWKASDRWKLRFGPYYSHLIGDLSDDRFYGKAYDGYIRENTPTGGYIEVSSADYDFSEELRRWNVGVQFGAEWKVLKHFAIAADLQWGLTDIFKKDFEVITFNMFPVYGNIGIVYIF